MSVRATESEFSASFVCEDTDAWGTFTERDDPLYLEECVELFLAPGKADPTDYFEFEVSPLGTLFDVKVHNPAGRRETMAADVKWDAPGAACNAFIAKQFNRWTASLVVPWADLGFPDPQALSARLACEFLPHRPAARRLTAPSFRAGRPHSKPRPTFTCPRASACCIYSANARTPETVG